MTKQLGAGAALEKVIRDDLPPHLELDPREGAPGPSRCMAGDDIAALESDVRGHGHVIDGTVNPPVLELRQGRTALARLLCVIDLPEAPSTTVLRAERAAHARWK